MKSMKIASLLMAAALFIGCGGEKKKDTPKKSGDAKTKKSDATGKKDDKTTKKDDKTTKKDDKGTKKEVARVLGMALRDSDPGLRLQAVEKLGAMESEIANKYLFGALKDPNPFVREKVLSVLGDRERTKVDTQTAQN